MVLDIYKKMKLISSLLRHPNHEATPGRAQKKNTFCYAYTFSKALCIIPSVFYLQTCDIKLLGWHAETLRKAG